MAKFIRIITIHIIRTFLTATRSFGLLSRETCRFQPSCSVYTEQAILNRGIITGGFLAIGRILRCNPMCQGGFDPVPERKIKT